MPRSTGPGANGSPGFRKKISPASWVPRRAPGAKPAATTSIQPGRSDNEDGPVELVLEVPHVRVPGKVDRDGEVHGHADLVAGALDGDVLLVEGDVELSGAGKDLLLDLFGRLFARRKARQLVHVVIHLGAAHLDGNGLPG